MDPITGAHTNAVESHWRHAKQRFKRMYGSHEHMIDGYLDEFQWRELFGKHGGGNTMDNITIHIGLWFNPNV